MKASDKKSIQRILGEFELLNQSFPEILSIYRQDQSKGFTEEIIEGGKVTVKEAEEMLTNFWTNSQFANSVLGFQIGDNFIEFSRDDKDKQYYIRVEGKRDLVCWYNFKEFDSEVIDYSQKLMKAFVISCRKPRKRKILLSELVRNIAWSLIVILLFGSILLSYLTKSDYASRSFGLILILFPFAGAKHLEDCFVMRKVVIHGKYGHVATIWGNGAVVYGIGFSLLMLSIMFLGFLVFFAYIA